MLFKILLLCLFFTAALSQSLDSYNIDTNRMSTSGLSAGGAMTVQFHVAHSSVLQGTGVIAGIPYWCAEGTLLRALGDCLKSGLLIIDATLEAKTAEYASSGLIDATSNLANTRVYLFSGTKDTIVNPGVMKKLYTYYEHYIPESQIQTDFSVPAEHAWITNNYGNACSYKGSPYINNCDLDISGKLLQQIYHNSTLKPPVTQVSANFKKFTQSKYAPSTGISLAETGILYVPTACQDKSTACGLHINFHGCEQGTDFIGSVYYENIGLNEWAESNNIIVVYPQTASSYISPFNPNGCWDWWGYTDASYANKKGPQMVFAANVLNAILNSTVF